MSDDPDTEHAAGVPTDDLAEILDAAVMDPNLGRVERETSIHWTAVDDEANFYTEEASLVRRFLLHPEATVDTLRVTDENAKSDPDARFGATVPPAEYESGMVTGVKGSLPHGAITVPQSSRNAAGVSAVIAEGVLDNDPRK